MASIKNLKKDINYVLGDVITYVMEVAAIKNKPKKADEIVDEAVVVYDDLIAKVNAKNVENKKAHFSDVKNELQTKSEALIEKANAL